MIRIPNAFRDYALTTEFDSGHPEADMRIDIPGRRIIFNAAARPNANVVRVRFSEWVPKRRWWRR